MRDKIFGLLSFAPACCRVANPVDYTCSAYVLCNRFLEHHHKSHEKDSQQSTIISVTEEFQALIMEGARAQRKSGSTFNIGGPHEVNVGTVTVKTIGYLYTDECHVTNPLKTLSYDGDGVWLREGLCGSLQKALIPIEDLEDKVIRKIKLICNVPVEELRGYNMHIEEWRGRREDFVQEPLQPPVRLPPSIYNVQKYFPLRKLSRLQINTPTDLQPITEEIRDNDNIEKENQNNSSEERSRDLDMSSLFGSYFRSIPEGTSTNMYPMGPLEYSKISELLDAAIETLSKQPVEKDVVFFGQTQDGWFNPGLFGFATAQIRTDDLSCRFEGSQVFVFVREVKNQWYLVGRAVSFGEPSFYLAEETRYDPITLHLDVRALQMLTTPKQFVVADGIGDEGREA